jgi:multidrug resistance protein MdtO
MPHMETIASLVVVVACASAIAGWVATGSEMISYAGLQIAFAFFYSVFQGYAPDTDLDNVRNRVVGILFGLIVTGLVFRYIWPERTIDRFRDAVRQALRQLARLLEIPQPEISIETAKAQAAALIPDISKTFDQARRYAELTAFEFDESPDRDRSALHDLESTQSHAEDVFAAATSLTSDEGWNEWQQLPPPAKIAESELRRIAAKQIERGASGDVAQHSDADLSRAFHAWHETVQPSASENSRNALVSRIVAGAEDLLRS